MHVSPTQPKNPSNTPSDHTPPDRPPPDRPPPSYAESQDDLALAQQATATFTGKDQDTSTAEFSGKAAAEPGLEAQINRFLGCNQETQNWMLHNEESGNSIIKTLDKAMPDGSKEMDEADIETVAEYLKNAHESPAPLEHQQLKQQAQAMMTAEAQKGQIKLTLDEWKTKVRTASPADRANIKSAITKDLTNVSTGNSPSNSWVAQAAEAQHRRHYDNKGKNKYFQVPFTKSARRAVAKSGQKPTSKIGKMLSSITPQRMKTWMKGNHGYTTENGKLTVLERKTFAGIHKYTSAKRFAKSTFNGILAAGLSGQNLTITLDTKNPQTARRQIKALTDEAVKRGIPLSSITIDTPNLNKQASSFLGKVWNGLCAATRFITRTKAQNKKIEPQTLQNIVNETAKGKSPYGFSSQSMIFTAGKQILKSPLTVLRYTAATLLGGKYRGDINRKHGSNMSKQWAQTMQKRAFGLDTAANKEAYRLGSRDLSSKKSNKLREGIDDRTYPDNAIGKANRAMNDNQLTLQERNYQAGQAVLQKNKADGTFSQVKPGEDSVERKVYNDMGFVKKPGDLYGTKAAKNKQQHNQVKNALRTDMFSKADKFQKAEEKLRQAEKADPEEKLRKAEEALAAARVNTSDWQDKLRSVNGAKKEVEALNDAKKEVEQTSAAALDATNKYKAMAFPGRPEKQIPTIATSQNQAAMDKKNRGILREAFEKGTRRRPVNIEKIQGARQKNGNNVKQSKNRVNTVVANQKDQDKKIPGENLNDTSARRLNPAGGG